ncbi:hypothetical protein Goshw_015848 [Gossypium schwendimanii]|uniref:Uncharacterized protein n=1 Tax=Gossypium schwendimanii TaxID=34291 RepID=A0A7J9MCB9_GOSSC|nr:hypothetical protein [Gossypium schwendimanii]
MSPHKFKDYSMVKMDIDVCVANTIVYTIENIDFRRPLANLMGLPVDIVKARLKDKNGLCISWSNIRDAMGKANGDRHLALLASIEEFLESEHPPNQSIEEWVQNHSTMTYQEIEWRA